VKIAAFKKYVEQVEKEILPNQIKILIKSAAEEAISQLEHGNWEIGTSDSDGFEIYWFLSGSYTDDPPVGTFVDVWLPKNNIDWLASKENDLPFLGLFTMVGGGRTGKSETKRRGELVSSAIKAAPSKLGAKLNKMNDFSEWYESVRRPLDDILSEEKLANSDKLKAELVKLFKEFSIAMIPGLKVAQKILSQS
jgi:hypothetical protein